MTNITDNCILDLDDLKARKAVIDLSKGVLVVNDTIVKGKYKYAEGTFLMPGDASLYIMNDSDSHIHLKDYMVVVVGHDALHIEEVSESDGLLTKRNGQSVLNKSMVPFIWME